MSSSLSLCGDGEPDLLGQEAQQSAKRNAKLVLLRYNHRNLQKKKRGKKAFFSMQDHKRLHGAVWKVCFVGAIPKTQVCWESRHEDSAFVNLHSTKIQV